MVLHPVMDCQCQKDIGHLEKGNCPKVYGGSVREHRQQANPPLLRLSSRPQAHQPEKAGSTPLDFVRGFASMPKLDDIDQAVTNNPRNFMEPSREPKTNLS